MGGSEETVGVVAALREEVGPLLARLTERRREAVPGALSWTGRLGARRLRVAVTGDGPELAERGLAAVVAAAPLARLLLVGIAGGLSPRLRPGEVVVSAAVVIPDGQRLDSPADERPAAVAGAAGTITSCRRIVGSRREKAALWERLGRPARAVVDTETAAWARVADRHGVPWQAIRVVADTAEESLPVDFNRLRGRDGGVSRYRVAVQALVRPWVVPRLLQLRRRLLHGGREIAGAVEEAVAR